MYIDTHAHLTMPEYSDLNSILARARNAGVEAIINASFDLESARASVKLADTHDFIYAAVGIHPHHAELVDDSAILELQELARDLKTVAIGEMGLDYFNIQESKELQQKAFRRLLNLAQDIDKPAIVHCRDAQHDTVKIIKEENRGKLRLVFHCFAGDDLLIKFAEDNNFYISFTGNVTFKKADSVRENAKKVPLERLLLETDCPYLSPEPFRGRVNEPSYITFIAEAMAKIKNVPVWELAERTTGNAKELFRI